VEGSGIEDDGTWINYYGSDVDLTPAVLYGFWLAPVVPVVSWARRRFQAPSRKAA